MAARQAASQCQLVRRAEEDAMNPGKQLRSAGLLAAMGVSGLAAYELILRPWHLRWGTTREETRRPMPGDELVHRPF
jgi:hypothetical protein